MPKTDRLRRICEIRQAEEQNQLLLLELARSELMRIEEALERARLRKMAGRELLQSSARSAELRDRIAGLEEVACASRVGDALSEQLQLAQGKVHDLQQRYLSKRCERRQVETLFRSELQRETEAANRRRQSSLDEWHRAKHFGNAKD